MLNEGWAIACEVGLWGWILAAVGLILHAFPSRAPFQGRSAACWGGSLLLLYALWVVGMLNV